MSWPFWVVVTAGQSVYDAIKAGEWYVSKIAAEATADQLRHINKKQYFVIGNDLEQQPLDVVDQTPDWKAPVSKLRMQETIADMVTGDSFYTVPWALGQTSEGNIYLSLDFSTHKERGGTVQMLVQKLGKNWYQVAPPKDYKYTVTNPHNDSKVSYNLNIL